MLTGDGYSRCEEACAGAGGASFCLDGTFGMGGKGGTSTRTVIEKERLEN